MLGNPEQFTEKAMLVLVHYQMSRVTKKAGITQKAVLTSYKKQIYKAIYKRMQDADKKKKEAKKEAALLIQAHKKLDWIDFADPRRVEYTLEMIHDTKAKKIKKIEKSGSTTGSPANSKKKKKT